MKALKTILALSLLLAAGNLRAGSALGLQNFSGSPSSVQSSAPFNLVFRVTNIGATVLAGVTASAGCAGIFGPVTPSAVVLPPSLDLNPGQEGAFTFTFTAAGCGTITFSGGAAAFDGSVISTDLAFWPVVVSCPAPVPTPQATAASSDQGTASIPNNIFKPFKDGPLKLRYTLPEAGTVSVKIYDRNGKNIFSREAASPAGPQEIAWDGRTASGDVAATGIYLVYFQGNGLRKTLKIAVVK